MKDSEEYRRELLKKVKQEPIHLETDEEMWEEVWGRISGGKPAKKSYFTWYAAAAAVFIFLTAGVIVYFMNTSTSPVAAKLDGKSIVQIEPEKTNKEKKEERSPAPDNSADPVKGKEEAVDEPAAVKRKTQTKLVAGKELVSRSLADGSIVTLNSYTSLEVTEIKDANLTSNLSGEAYFEVKQDKKRSFKVFFGNSYLVVIGTKFNVRNVKGESRQQVAVVEGIVKVYPNKSGKGVEVKSGEVLTIDPDKNASYVTKNDPLHYIAWKTGKLHFRKTSMEEVAEALERVYKINVKVEKTVKECTFTGDLSQTPLEEALQIIGATTSLQIKRTKDNVHISGSPCN